MPLVDAARRFEGIHRGLGFVSGSLRLTFGLSLVYQIGFAHGLFTSHPRWTPG